MELKEILDLIFGFSLSFFALLTSIVAVVFTYIGLRIQRKHNHKSLKPIGKLRTLDYENHISIKIENYGTGPLIIKAIYLNGEDIGNNGIINYIPKKFADSLVWKTFTGSYPGRAILPNGELELLTWSDKNYKKKESKKIAKDKRKLRTIIKDFKLKLLYYGIYEHELYTDEIDLKWYGRNL